VTDPREPFETDSPVEGAASPLATDLDDTRMDAEGAADLETGAGETGAAEGSTDTVDTLDAEVAVDADEDAAPAAPAEPEED